jgi:hypothetical protein
MLCIRERLLSDLAVGTHVLDESDQFSELATLLENGETGKPIVGLVKTDAVLLHVEIDLELVSHFTSVGHKIEIDVRFGQRR